MHKSRVALLSLLLTISLSLTLNNAYGVDAFKDASNLPELTPDDVVAPNPKLTDTVNFTDLRNTYAKRSDFELRCEFTRPTKEWADAMQSGKYKEAYDVVTKWFDKCPVDERAHLWGIITLQKLGETAKIEDHKRWWIGLTDSSFKTGDGKTPQTAFVTISVSEEYALLTRMQLKPVKQELVTGPPTVDRIDAVPVAGGEQQSIYFNPEWHFIRLMHMTQDVKTGK
jgi:hypothetical protein